VYSCSDLHVIGSCTAGLHAAARRGATAHTVCARAAARGGRARSACREHCEAVCLDMKGRPFRNRPAIILPFVFAHTRVHSGRHARARDDDE
jgi:hypothetical protein